MASLEVDLRSFYDQEAEQRRARAIDPHRVRLRATYASLLDSEDRHRLLEVGTGPGHDAAAFLARGLAVTGVDLSGEHVQMCLAAGVDARVSSVHRMPFADDAFDAAWTMSTLLHVPDADFDSALQRFFSFRSDERLQEMLRRHGEIEQFHTWLTEGSGPYSYQSVLLRVA